MIFVGLLAAVVAFHPPVVLARTHPPTRRTGAGLLAGAVGVGIVAMLGEPVLDLIGVSAPTFRSAAGAVVGITGLRWLLGPPPAGDPATLDPAAAGALACVTPSFVMATLALSVDEGWRVTLVGVALAVAATWWSRRSAWLRGTTAVRLSGAAAMVIGGLLLIDGIRSV